MLIFDQPAESAGTPANVTGLLAGRQGQGLDMLPDDGRERAQHAAEAAQRQAEDAMKEQIDAVAKAEDGVNAGTSSPPLSDTQVAQRALEHAQAEREAAQLAKEQEIRDAEEKARLEAEAEAAAKRASPRSRVLLNVSSSVEMISWMRAHPSFISGKVSPRISTTLGTSAERNGSSIPKVCRPCLTARRRILRNT